MYLLHIVCRYHYSGDILLVMYGYQLSTLGNIFIITVTGLLIPPLLYLETTLLFLCYHPLPVVLCTWSIVYIQNCTFLKLRGMGRPYPSSLFVTQQQTVGFIKSVDSQTEIKALQNHYIAYSQTIRHIFWTSVILNAFNLSYNTTHNINGFALAYSESHHPSSILNLLSARKDGATMSLLTLMCYICVVLVCMNCNEIIFHRMKLLNAFLFAWVNNLTNIFE